MTLKIIQYSKDLMVCQRALKSRYDVRFLPRLERPFPLPSYLNPVESNLIPIQYRLSFFYWYTPSIPDQSCRTNA